MNLGTQDRELSDLLDFSAMFNPPNGPSSSRASAAPPDGPPSSGSQVHAANSSRPGLEEGWTSYDARPFDVQPTGSLFGEDESDLLSSSRKALSSTTAFMPVSNAQGKSKELYGSVLLGSVPQQSSSLAGRRAKSAKGNHPSLRAVYSPGADDIMSHPTGMYPTEPYFLDGGSPDPWGHHMTSTNNIRNQVSHSLPGGYDMAYQSLADAADSRLPATLPPMSTFRQTSAAQPNSQFLQNSIPSPATSGGPPARIGSSSSQTADALGKALASMYSTDAHSNPSYSSNPSTPVSSPPPLISDRTGGAGVPPTTTASHSNGPWPHGVTSQSPSTQFDHMQTLSRMEERLDDAIWVLKNHAESATICNPLTGLPYPANALPPGLTETLQNASAVDSEHSIDGGSNLLSNSVVSGNHDSDDKDTPKSKSQAAKSRKRAVRSESSQSTAEKRDIDTNDPCSDEEDGPNKGAREQERRYANNARERLRVRDINEAFKELGRMCNLHIKTDKPQAKPFDKSKPSNKDRDANGANCSKLVILHQAVSVITSLESQVRERNLNPKAACLKRREEEKVDETPEKRLAIGSVPSDSKRNGRRGVATQRRDDQVLMDPPVFSH